MRRNVFLITVLLMGACAEDDFTFEVETETTPATVSNKPCGLGKQCVRPDFCSARNTNGANIFDPRLGSDGPEGCPHLEVCCSQHEIITAPIVLPRENTGCGYRNLDGVGPRIDGLGTSEFGEFPWMLMILRRKKYFSKERNFFHCGGSLIHPRIALTGAHCVYGRRAIKFQVRAGEWNVSTETELYPHQDRKVVDMVLHEEYDNENLHNDIALLFLDTPFELGPNVNTVCLPPAGLNFDFAQCYASGWGKNKFQNGEYQKVLKKVDLPIVPRGVCQNRLRQTRLGRYFELHKGFLCAGGQPGKDTCKGDGGGPLVCQVENTVDRYYQVGILAWGIGCFDGISPRVCVSVAEFRPWIDEKLSRKQINATYFTA